MSAVAGRLTTAERASLVTTLGLRGHGAETIVDALVEGGLAEDVARAEVASVLGSPIFLAAAASAELGSAFEEVARLYAEVDDQPVREVERVDVDELYLAHWLPHRPLVLRGGALGWRSAAWTWADLRARHAWSPLDVLERGPRWWLQPRQVRRMAFGDFVDVVLGPPTDALYADGRSLVLEQAGLFPLREDLGLLPGLVGDGTPRAWVGPAGTVTPTHHDQSTAWQVVLLGRKRLHLASPLEPELAARAQGLFSLAPDEPTPTPVRWHTIELGPGDAAFVPVGWWHQVEALEPSFTVSMSSFQWPNRFDWYLPGRRRAG
ncbi:MAG: cupin-like domain-containing protein [Alphaproteobacteria bacterium]|nr:cupin-like domain-containing protein [Alphaproteobacteria bacterium]